MLLTQKRIYNLKPNTNKDALQSFCSVIKLLAKCKKVAAMKYLQNVDGGYYIP